MASRMLVRASSRVSPWLMQPGITGHSTTKPPSSSGVKITGSSCTVAMPVVYQISPRPGLPGLGGERRRRPGWRGRARSARGGLVAGGVPKSPWDAGAAVPKLRAAGRSTMPAPRQPGPLACPTGLGDGQPTPTAPRARRPAPRTPQDGSAAAPGSVVRRRSHLTDDLLSSRIARRFRKRCRGRFHRRPVPPRSATA